MKAPGIRGRLAMLVLASTAPAVLFAWALLSADWRSDRERFERDTIARTRAMVHAVDRELISITAAAEVLSTSQRARAGDLAGFREQAREVVARKIAANVVLVGTDGRQVMNLQVPAGEPLPMHGSQAVVRDVLSTGQPALTGFYAGGAMRRPIVSVTVPVSRGAKVIYVLTVSDVPDRFRAILADQQVPAGWIGTVFDTTGLIVARTRDQERFVGNNDAPALTQRMVGNEEGTLETTTPEGIPVFYAFSRSPETGWVAALAVPSAALSERLWQRARAVAFSVAAIAALGLLFAWGIGGRIARSIHGLAAPAARIGLRQRIAVAPLGLKEADEVARALERASELISNAEHRAQHDALTGLANRALFLEIAAQQIERCKREKTRLAVMFIDLDNFKRVNDEHGHDAGDRLLVAVATRLRSAVRGSDVAARIGGDEFAVLLVNAAAPMAAEVAAKLVDTLSEPYGWDAGMAALRVEISASIGVAGYPESGTVAEQLLKRADEAMYKVKLGGKRGHALAAHDQAAHD
jgi:diguanylate cyclase (GGDEF)-like protein